MLKDNNKDWAAKKTISSAITITLTHIILISFPFLNRFLHIRQLVLIAFSQPPLTPLTQHHPPISLLQQPYHAHTHAQDKPIRPPEESNDWIDCWP